jgi:hypothetical protein
MQDSGLFKAMYHVIRLLLFLKQKLRYMTILNYRFIVDTRTQECTNSAAEDQSI